MERRGLNIRKGFLKAVLADHSGPCRCRWRRGLSRASAGWNTGLSPSSAASRSTTAVAHGQIGAGLASGMCRAVSRELAGNHVLWRTRDLLLDGVPDARAREHVHRDRAESIWTRPSALGRGCIVLANHFGAHLLPAHWLFRENFPVRFYMERPRHISRFLSRHFETDGPLGQDKLFISRQGVPADSASSILRAARTIKAGMLLYLAGDVRWTGQLTEHGRLPGPRRCDSRRPGSSWPR